VRGRGGQVAAYAVVVLFLLWVLIPIVVVALNSIKPAGDIFSDPPHWIFSPTTEHYREVLGRLHFSSFFRHSAVVAIGSSLLSLALGTPAAYALARLPLRGREWWAWLALFARMVPAIVLVVPMYALFHQAGLIGTYWALILAHTAFNLPLVIWMMRSFFEDLPRSLDEAARVDGAGTVGTFLRIALPLSAPGLTACGILCMLFSWNEFLFALVLSGEHTATVPIGVSSFIGSVSIDWGGSSAAAVLALIPVFILALAVQRFLVRGLTMGAVKG